MSIYASKKRNWLTKYLRFFSESLRIFSNSSFEGFAPGLEGIAVWAGAFEALGLSRRFFGDPILEAVSSSSSSGRDLFGELHLVVEFSFLAE